MRARALAGGIPVVLVRLSGGNTQILPLGAAEPFGDVHDLPYVVARVGEGAVQGFVHAQGNAAQAPAALPRTAAPAGAMVYFISPENGARVTSPVTVRFGLRGMGVAPAGVTNPNTGHHHLLVDTDLTPGKKRPSKLSQAKM